MCDECRQVMRVRVSDCMFGAEFGHSSFFGLLDRGCYGLVCM